MDGSNAPAGAVSVEIRGGRCPRAPASPPPGAGRKRRAVARGVQSALAKTSMLANFLPTDTLLAFEVALPAASGDGSSCSPASAAAIWALLALCAASCFLSHFADSFRAPDGEVYYGLVTPGGLSLLRTGAGLGVEAPREDRYRLAFVDVVHAAMSVLVFAAVALADYRVSGCLLPGHRKEMGAVMESFPLVVGAVCSGLFMVFPNTRYGIGCLAHSNRKRSVARPTIRERRPNSWVGVIMIIVPIFVGSSSLSRRVVNSGSRSWRSSWRSSNMRQA